MAAHDDIGREQPDDYFMNTSTWSTPVTIVVKYTIYSLDAAGAVTAWRLDILDFHWRLIMQPPWATIPMPCL